MMVASWLRWCAYPDIGVPVTDLDLRGTDPEVVWRKLDVVLAPCLRIFSCSRTSSSL